MDGAPLPKEHDMVGDEVTSRAPPVALGEDVDKEEK